MVSQFYLFLFLKTIQGTSDDASEKEKTLQNPNKSSLKKIFF